MGMASVRVVVLDLVAKRDDALPDSPCARPASLSKLTGSRKTASRFAGRNSVQGHFCCHFHVLLAFTASTAGEVEMHRVDDFFTR